MAAATKPQSKSTSGNEFPLRSILKTNRQVDFATEKGLTAQTGHGRADWPLAVVKELVDNAIDACEEHRISPDITITVDDDGIAVQHSVSDSSPKILSTT